MNAAPRRNPNSLKDAVIGVAILVLVLLLWRLMTRSERWGSYGPWLKTNVFGASGIRLAETFGQGNGGAKQPGGTASDSAPTETPAPNSPTNSSFTVVTQSLSAADSAKSDDSLSATNPVKVIAAMPAEVSEVSRASGQPHPLSTSPDAAAFARRLGEVNARGGDIQISLFWKNFNDLDLHCFDPGGEHIWFSNTKSARTGGELDVDQNAHSPFNSSPVENIYWPARGASAGIYRVYVTHYAQHGGGDPTPYTVRTVVQNKTNYFAHTIHFSGQRELNWICTIQYDPANPDPSKRCRFLPLR